MNTPIRRKLMRMVLLTSGLVIVFTCAMFVTYEVVTFKQGVARQIDILSKAIAQNSTAALAFDNVEDARAVLSAFKADPHIMSAALVRQVGRLVRLLSGRRGRRRSAHQAQAPGYRFENRNVIGFEPVRLEGKLLGTLFVKSDLKAIDDRFTGYALITAMVIALAVMLAYFVAKQQQSQISQPLLDLADTARAVSDKHDYSVRAKSTGAQEIAVLTDAFNHMLTEIQRAEVRSRAQMQRLSLLQHITGAIGDRQDLPSIFQVVLRNVEENLPVDFGCVCLYDSATATLTVSTVGAASRDLSASLDLTEGATVPIDENGLSSCIRGRLVYEPDTRKIPFPFPRRFADAAVCLAGHRAAARRGQCVRRVRRRAPRSGCIQQRRLRVPACSFRGTSRSRRTRRACMARCGRPTTTCASRSTP